MISVTCKCGKALRVGDHLAGRLGRCPQCKTTLRIPGGKKQAEAGQGPAPRSGPTGDNADALAALAAAGGPSQQGSPRPQAEVVETARAVGRIGEAIGPNVLPMVAGFLLLATIFIPWMVVGPKVVMSWDVVSEAPGAVNALLIGSWMIGLVAVVVSFLLKRMALSLACAGLGLVGLVLLLSLLGAGPDFDRPRGAVALASADAIGAMVTLLVVLLIVALNLRLRLHGVVAVRILQGIAGGALAILAAAGFFRTIGQFSDMPQAVKRDLVLDLIVVLLVGMCTILGGIMAAAALPGAKGRKLAQAALILIYANLSVAAGYLLIRPATVADSGWLVLLFLNIILLVGSIIALLCTGLIRSVVDVRAHVLEAQPAKRQEMEQPAATSGPSMLEQRLAELARLKAQGLISEQEYADARQKALGEIRIP